jgi:lysophospholipase L1-like esterase
MKSKIASPIIFVPTLIAGISLLFIFTTAMDLTIEKQSISYLALGDSYTIGEQVLATETFPHHTKGLLAEKGIALSPTTVIAKTGWTTDELQAAIKAAALKQEFDFVTLLIGVNNQYRGRTVSNYAIEFEKLLNQAILFTANKTDHVIVLSIPDWGVTPYASGKDREQISKEINKYNQANREIAMRLGVHYLDITPSTRKAAEDPALLAVDGLHPSGKLYAIWARQVAEIMEKELKNEGTR